MSVAPADPVPLKGATGPTASDDVAEAVPTGGDADPAKEAAKPGELEDGERLKRTLFVGNVSCEASRKELKRLFTPFGAVESVRLRGAVAANPLLPKKVALLAKRLHKGVDTLLAYVVLKPAEDLETVIAEACAGVNMTIFREKHLRVMPAEVRTAPRRQSVFLGNLPFDVTEEEIILLFQPAVADSGAKVVGCRVTRDKETGIGKGIGFVSFDDDLGVRSAMNQVGDLKIRGRPVRMERAGREKKRNTKTFKKNLKASKKAERNSEGPSALSTTSLERRKKRSKGGELGTTRKIKKERSEKKTRTNAKKMAKKATKNGK